MQNSALVDPTLDEDQQELRRRELMIRFAVLHSLAVKGERIPVIVNPSDDRHFVSNKLERMAVDELVEIDAENNRYKLMPKGRELLKRFQAMTEALRALDIFARVDLERSLTADEYLLAEGENPEDQNQMRDSKYDPRLLVLGDANYERARDLRHAMMGFLAFQNPPDAPAVEYDAHLAIFVQQCMDGQLEDKNFWFDLQTGRTYRDIDEKIEAYYKWREIAGPGGSEDDALAIMSIYWVAGMTEEVKRAGHDCESCQSALGMAELLAKKHGKEFTECPYCGVSYLPPPPAPEPVVDYHCSHCQAGVSPNQFQCLNCGYDLDFDLEPGQVVKETTTETVYEEIPGHRRNRNRRRRNDWEVDVLWGGYSRPRVISYDDIFDPYGSLFVSQMYMPPSIVIDIRL